jgi:hypothetical protein
MHERVLAQVLLYGNTDARRAVICGFYLQRIAHERLKREMHGVSKVAWADDAKAAAAATTSH